MKRIRTVDGCYKAIKEMDSETSITKWFIRQLVVNGEVPSFKSGNKYLVDLDALVAFLEKQF